MTENEVAILANKLNEEVAELLNTLPLRIRWNFRKLTSPRCLGLCIQNRSKQTTSTEIRINRLVWFYQAPSNTINTILHELCHAYAPFNSKHGYEWQRLAQLVGDHYDTNIARLTDPTTKAFENDHAQQAQQENLLARSVAKCTCPQCNTTTYVRSRKSTVYKRKGDGFHCAKCNLPIVFEEIS